MALDTIRQVLGQTAMRGLQERSATGRAALLGQQLQNALQARQLDELFPLQIQQLQKQVANILDPQQAIDNAISEYTKKKAVEEDTEKAILGFRETFEKNVLAERNRLENAPMSPERLRQELQLRQASKYDQPKNVQTVPLLQDAQGKPSTVPHLWQLKPDGTLGNYIGPTQPKGTSTAAAPKTSVSALRALREAQTGKVNYKGEEIPGSDEFYALREAMRKPRQNKKFYERALAPADTPEAFFDSLVAQGWPHTEAEAAKYPAVAQAVREWRNSLVTQGPSEMMLQGGEDEELVQFNGMTFQRNPDGSLTRVQ